MSDPGFQTPDGYWSDANAPDEDEFDFVEYEGDADEGEDDE